MSFSAIAAVPLLASLVLAYRASPNTVYVAADSRLTSPLSVQSSSGDTVPTFTPNDTACKIRVLRDGVVFVGTGNALFSAYRLRTNIYTVAAKAAATLPRRPLEPADIRRVAFIWQTTIHARLLAKLRSSPAAAPGTSLTESTTGTTGAFYSLTADGSVYGITLRVALNASGVLENIQEPETLSGYLVATGTNEAKQQALAIASAPGTAALPWPRRLQSIEAQTMRKQFARYGSRSDIGGPIDIIEISSKGPVWLARKAGCH
jgi:hypothetical protein